MDLVLLGYKWRDFIRVIILIPNSVGSINYILFKVRTTGGMLQATGLLGGQYQGYYLIYLSVNIPYKTDNGYNIHFFPDFQPSFSRFSVYSIISLSLFSTT